MLERIKNKKEEIPNINLLLEEMVKKDQEIRLRKNKTEKDYED